MKASRVSQPRTIRLISSANHKPPVLQGLASTFGTLSDLEELESVTSGRLEMEQQGIPGIAPDSLATGFGYTYINASFAYTRPRGNRFNTEKWGAWYCGFDFETTKQEVIFHLTRALQAASESFDNETRCVELIADFEADFIDLRDITPQPDCLDPDVSIGYPRGQQLATAVRESGHNGIVYPSVRHDGGTCLVAFWPGLVRNFIPGDTWIFKWAGSPEPSISKGTT